MDGVGRAHVRRHVCFLCTHYVIIMNTFPWENRGNVGTELRASVEKNPIIRWPFRTGGGDAILRVQSLCNSPIIRNILFCK